MFAIHHRRRFLETTLASGAMATLGNLERLGRLPAVSAAEAQADNEDESVDVQPTADAPPDEKPEVKRRLDAMAARVGGIRAWREKKGERQVLESHPEPLFRLIDATRDHPDGTLWAWPRKGRPAAMLTLSLLGGSQRWLFEFVSFTSDPVGAKFGVSREWACRRPGWDPRSFTEGPHPGNSPRERLRQMRALARRFRAFGTLPPETREEQRLLPQPVLRYSDADAGQLDGAIFLFCHGTNPEVLLVIEAHQESGQEAVWQYALARNTIAELAVDLDGKQVWTRPLISFGDARPDNPYCIAVDSLNADEDALMNNYAARKRD